MHEHPVLGAVLFAFGVALVAASFLAANAGGNGTDALVLGHLLALNGTLLAVLGSGRHSPARLRNHPH
jgi:hypothetical protein